MRLQIQNIHNVTKWINLDQKKQPSIYKKKLGDQKIIILYQFSEQYLVMSATNFYSMGYIFFGFFPPQHKTTSEAITVEFSLYTLLIKYCIIIPIKIIFLISTGILTEKPLLYSHLEY